MRKIGFGMMVLLFLALPCCIHAQSSNAAADAALQEEILKRQEEVFTLNSNLDEGYKFLDAKSYSKAQERFDAVIRKTDPLGASAALHERARTGRAKISAIMAEEAESKNDLNGAYKNWQEAVNYAPKDKEYAKHLDSVKGKIDAVENQYGGNTAVTPELKSKIEKVNELLTRGSAMVSVGRYNEATLLYQEVLRIDPYNSTAIKQIEAVEKLKYEANTLRMKAAKQEALYQVDSQWSPKAAPKKDSASSIKVSGATSSKVPDIYRKLSSIKIPELNFTDVEISQALAFLVDQSRKLDPDKKGVNIVFKPGSGTPPNVSFSLRDAPLGDVLDIIRSTTGLQVKVEDNAVFILPVNEVSDVMLVRSFTVDPGFFGGKLPPGNKAAGLDVKNQMVNDRGLLFPEGSTATYFQSTSRLVVRNTADMLNQIEQLVSLERGKDMPQVEIESKFVQFSETQMKELRFRWQMNFNPMIPSATLFPDGPAYPTGSGAKVGGETGGLRGFGRDDISLQSGIGADNLDAILITGGNAQNPTSSTLTLGGLIDGNAVQLLISAMNHVAGNDVVSAPKLTLKRGAQGTISSSRKFVYPGKYDPPQINSGQGGSITPANPSEFNFTKPRDVGVVMTVKVNDVNPTSRLIELDMPNVEITDFEGFINYGDDVTTVDPGTYISGILVNGVALQPVFSVRKISTSVQLRDGQGLVMGGLIRDDIQEVNDKVPLFGDLPIVGRVFRSKAKQTIKKNLIIVTTARLIGTDGKPVNPMDSSLSDTIETVAK